MDGLAAGLDDLIASACPGCLAVRAAASAASEVLVEACGRSSGRARTLEGDAQPDQGAQGRSSAAETHRSAADPGRETFLARGMPKVSDWPLVKQAPLRRTVPFMGRIPFPADEPTRCPDGYWSLTVPGNPGVVVREPTRIHALRRALDIFTGSPVARRERMPNTRS